MNVISREEEAVNRALEAQPKNDAQLFDMLHSLFGIGDFDEDGVPWFRFRMTEIAKLKAIRKRRSITLADYAMHREVLPAASGAGEGVVAAVRLHR